MINKAFLIVCLIGTIVCGVDARGDESDSAAEIRVLRERLERQAAEIEQLRAAVRRLDDSTTAPPQISASPAPSQAPSDTSRVKFSGLLQGWAMAGDASFQDTFRIRRAELKLSSSLGRDVAWTVMLDPSKSLSHANVEGQTVINQSGRPLQDAFLTFGKPERVLVTAGQFKIPLSREGLESSAVLDTVERALFISDRSRSGTYGDIRDVGVSVRRSVPNRYDVVVGLFNGTGESQNDVDRNERKAFVARSVFAVPVVAGLQLGASAAWGGGRDADRRDRVGADVLYARGRWKLKSELMTGRDGALERAGFYAHAAARLNRRLEVVARFDEWDPDTSADRGVASALERDYLIGCNVSFESALRLQANLIRKTWAGGVVPARNLLLINIQTTW